MSDLYFCPTAREVESATGGGFDICCTHPELHVPMPDDEATAAVSQAFSDAAKREFGLQQQVARIRAFLEDMAGWCSPHGVAADYSRRALDALDGVDPLGLAGPRREEVARDDPQRYTAGDFLRAPKTGETPTLSDTFDAEIELPELTTEDAIEAMQDMGTELYKAEDRLAFIAEMCTAAEQDGSTITVERLRSWLAYTGCGGVIMLPETDEHPAGVALPAAGEEQP